MISSLLAIEQESGSYRDRKRESDKDPTGDSQLQRSADTVAARAASRKTGTKDHGGASHKS
jgi:hypothetical protein